MHRTIEAQGFPWASIFTIGIRTFVRIVKEGLGDVYDDDNDKDQCDIIRTDENCAHTRRLCDRKQLLGHVQGHATTSSWR